MSRPYIVELIEKIFFFLKDIFESSYLYRLTSPKKREKKDTILNSLIYDDYGVHSKSYEVIKGAFSLENRDKRYMGGSNLINAFNNEFTTFILTLLISGLSLLFTHFFFRDRFGIKIPVFFMGFFIVGVLIRFLCEKSLFGDSLIVRFINYAFNLEDRLLNEKNMIKPFGTYLKSSFIYAVISSLVGIFFYMYLGAKIGVSFLFLASVLPFIKTYRLFFLSGFLMIYPILPDALILLAEIGFFFLYIIDICEGKRIFPKKNTMFIPIILLILTYIIQTITSLNMMGSMRDLAFNIGGFFIFLTIYNEVRDKNDLNILLSAIVVGALFLSLYGIFQYKFMGTVRREWIDASLKGVITKRAYSVFLNPNVFAEYLVITIPIAVSLFFAHRDRFKKFVYLSISLLEMLVLFLTFSRGGLLSTGIAAFVFLWVVYRPLIFLSIPALLLGFNFLPITFQNRILSIFNFSDSSTSYRFKMWGITKNLIQENPVVGVGLGHKAFKQEFEQMIRSMPIYHAHNTYLEVLAETGAVGFVTFLYCIVASFINLLRGPLKTSDRFIRMLGAGILSAGFAILAHGIFEHIIYINRIIVMLWTLLSISAVLKNIAKENTPRN